MFIHDFVKNLPLRLAVKEFWISTSSWQSYSLEYRTVVRFYSLQWIMPWPVFLRKPVCASHAVFTPRASLVNTRLHEQRCFTARRYA